MKVPLLDVNAQNLPLEEELTATFTRVLHSGRFIMGPEVEELEQEVAEFVGARHGIGVTSGTDAILVALMALGIGPGDEVLCPTFTFFATAGCIARTGATPVFVDACPVCFNIDVEDAARKVTARTKAIVPVHLFGQAAEMDEVMALAGEHDLRVIEDAAQAIGARYRGRGCGSMGDFGTYSFFPSKNLGGFGDGGLVVCNDDALAERTRMLRMHGSKPKYFHREVGGNFRLDPLQAALLRVKLRYYDSYTRARQENAAYYVEKLSLLEGVAPASPEHCCCARAQEKTLGETRVVLPVCYEHNQHIWNQFTLRVRGKGRRDALRDHLMDRGIGCEIYYPLTMDQQECFASLPESSRQGNEVAHSLAAEVLSIPVYPELTREMQDHVVAAVGEFLGADQTKEG
ncbi:MAG: glutamine--scyllo-inositol aminotransferase [Roseibacillus sp.]|nr:glutamine--scyllo-inositol aminotransferase [Roseibacillus sp.]